MRQTLEGRLQAPASCPFPYPRASPARPAIPRCGKAGVDLRDLVPKPHRPTAPVLPVISSQTMCWESQHVSKGWEKLGNQVQALLTELLNNTALRSVRWHHGTRHGGEGVTMLCIVEAGGSSLPAPLPPPRKVDYALASRQFRVTEIER